MVQSGLLERLSPKQRLALFISALCHDLEHPVRVCSAPAGARAGARAGGRRSYLWHEGRPGGHGHERHPGTAVRV